jgi:hypothetical protein
MEPVTPTPPNPRRIRFAQQQITPVTPQCQAAALAPEAAPPPPPARCVGHAYRFTVEEAIQNGIGSCADATATHRRDDLGAVHAALHLRLSPTPR